MEVTPPLGQGEFGLTASENKIQFPMAEYRRVTLYIIKNVDEK